MRRERECIYYIGMDLADKSYYWIAEEALNATLPPEWSV
jgi:hypothetical protein